MSDPAPKDPADVANLFIGNVARLAQLFHVDLAELGEFEHLHVRDLPLEPRNLLAHTDHMTVTLEAFHNSLVDVEVLAERNVEDSYARETLLRRQTDGAVVQFGIVRIWLGSLPEVARQEMTSRRLPLGRVLIRHNVLRDVELITVWRVKPGPAMRPHLGDQPVYGRTAQILVQERPTVQLLEVVRV